MRLAEIQNRLGKVGLVVETIDVLQSSHKSIVGRALKLCVCLFAGGNSELQACIATILEDIPYSCKMNV